MEHVLAGLAPERDADAETDAIRIAIIGRPNVANQPSSTGCWAISV